MFNLKNIFLIIIGNILLACSVQWFVVPHDIPIGGATGLALIISNFLLLDMETIVLAINMICLPIAYFYDGKKLLFGSIVSSYIYPLCLEIAKILPDLSFLGNSLLISTFLSGIISGIGVGFVLKVGASNGGLDIICIVLSKKLSISASSVMWVIDTVVMLGEIFFVDLSKIVYGIIGVYVMTKTIEWVVNR